MAAGPGDLAGTISTSLDLDKIAFRAVTGRVARVGERLHATQPSCPLAPPPAAEPEGEGASAEGESPAEGEAAEAEQPAEGEAAEAEQPAEGEAAEEPVEETEGESTESQGEGESSDEG
jgi:hypothetical protein